MILLLCIVSKLRSTCRYDRYFWKIWGKDIWETQGKSEWESIFELKFAVKIISKIKKTISFISRT